VIAKNAKRPEKKVTLCLEGLDGNAFVLLGRFQSQAKRGGWAAVDIEDVLREAKSRDYSHLLSVLNRHSTCPSG